MGKNDAGMEAGKIMWKPGDGDAHCSSPAGGDFILFIWIYLLVGI